ncbi:MAG: Lon protease family protein [Kiloniellales bacterium]
MADSATRPQRLEPQDLGLPRFEVGPSEEGDVFSLSSHVRAREALEFGLTIQEPGFNIFVLGEDRSGRMTSTLAFLETMAEKRPRQSDWIYLANFRHPDRPKPYRLPAGVGRRFRDRMALLVPRLREALTEAFGTEGYQTKVRSRDESHRREVGDRIEALRHEAQSIGLDIAKTHQGALVIAAPTDSGMTGLGELPAEQRDALGEAGETLVRRLNEINRWAQEQQGRLVAWLADLNRQVADQAVSALFEAVMAEFSAHGGLARWLTEAKNDAVESYYIFLPSEQPEEETEGGPPERRYAVNLLVDHGDDPHATVVLEANPTYDNLFGRLDYRQTGGLLTTDFTLIRAGSLHRANGGFLVLRAEALAQNTEVWKALKSVLRDREIRIESQHDSGGSGTVAGSPRPKPVPLAIKVVVVGAPRWYYAFFSADPDFQTYFKVKADIDSDMEATPHNLACYGALIQGMAARHGGRVCSPEALQYLLGVAARWAGRRERLTARFELIEDLLSEAIAVGHDNPEEPISAAAVAEALDNRRKRNARVEDRMQESISKGTVMIDTKGAVIGQVNALVVRDLGDHAFGAPVRITARNTLGRRGIINIERDTELGGPIQHKGVMVLQGFLGGHFARQTPLSFNCSITFEQSYGAVEGDSAMLAELLAVLSDLAQAPLRQDLAVTGSLNQRGQVQAVGGIHNKVEGFFRTCRDKGPLTGSQGVLIPAINAVDLVLRQEVIDAVAERRFHIYPVATVEAAIGLMTGLVAGTADSGGNYPRDSFYGRVMGEIDRFDRILLERES